MVSTNEFLNKIKEYDSIVIFGHMTCDGDCYSSEIALREIIRINFPNKKVYAVGSGLPKFFDILGRLDNPSDEVISNSLGILVDVNHQDRSEDKRIILTKEIIKIDHHINLFSFTILFSNFYISISSYWCIKLCNLEILWIIWIKIVFSIKMHISS